MRFRDLVRGGSVTENITLSGVQMRGMLSLSAIAEHPYAAVTKAYVDSRATVFKATSVSVGTLPTSQFTGDVGYFPSSQAFFNDGSIVLKATGVVPGAYTRVAVQADGRVASGVGKVQPSEMPNFSWTKVNTGKPSTATGYGITDALTAQGGDLTSKVSLFNDPSSDSHAATKKYVAYAVSLITLDAGTLRLTGVQGTLAGWLQCNSGALSKSLYPGLYAAVGDVYTNALIAQGTSTDPAFFRLPNWTAPSTQGPYLYIKT